jgi:GNAT superfamily N-acetyltransferase
MHGDAISVEAVKSRDAMNEFAMLPLQVYGERDAWWPPDIQNEIDLLSGRAPIASYLDMMPFALRRKGKIIARVTAVVNRRYNSHWNELLGQLIHFEALPGEGAGVAAMLEDACTWLRGRGLTAVRSGFAAFLDYPYAIDNYGSLPPFLLRGSPEYYHTYFKDAGFQTEKGMTDFTIALTQNTLSTYPAMIEQASNNGIRICSWREHGFLAAVDAWTDTTNAAFERHWGWNPITREEVRPMLAGLARTEVADLSTLAVADGEVVGSVFSVPDFSLRLARMRHGVRLDPARGGGTRGALINIGVLERWRGKGVNLAMAARSFATMAQQKMKYAGYTLVLDDNWPSRRTAQKLGASITSNFVAYRRDFFR